MDALGALSPLEVIEGKIQAKVARFLSLKSMINRLRGSSQINIKAKAEGLYIKQLQLETALNVNLQAIEQMKKGPWDMGSVVRIGGFAMELHKQINAVDDLQQNAISNNAMPAGGFGIDFAGLIGQPLVWGVGALAIAYIIFNR